MFVYFCLFYVHKQVASTPGWARDTIIYILSHTMIRVACCHSFVVTRVSFTSTVLHFDYMSCCGVHFASSSCLSDPANVRFRFEIPGRTIAPRSANCLAAVMQDFLEHFEVFHVF